MIRLARLLTLLLMGGGCSPEVVIATRDGAVSGGPGAPNGASGGGNGGAGAISTAGGAGASGALGAEGGEGGATDAPEPRRLLADSIADFSFVQGEHGWYYGSDNGSLASFKLMTRTSVITTFVPLNKDVWDCWANDSTHWSQLFRLGGHPNGTDTSDPSPKVLERVVRRWVSDYAGPVVVSGEIAKFDLVGSNGVDGSVYVDGERRDTWFIQGDDGAGNGFTVRAVLKLGSTVDLVLDPHDSDDHHDLSRFTAVIARDELAAP